MNKRVKEQIKVTITINKCIYTLRKKGTKAVTGAVPFQKTHFCT